MKLSARNKLFGTVLAIKEGAVNGVVSIDLGENIIKAEITMEAVRDLHLVEGAAACAIVKADDICFALEAQGLHVSSRNCFPGRVASVQREDFEALVRFATTDGTELVATLPCVELDDLGLAQGDAAVAVVKSTDILVAVEE